VKDDEIRISLLLNILFRRLDQLEAISLLPPDWIRKDLCEAVGFVLVPGVGKKLPDNSDMADQNVFFFENEMNRMHLWPFYPVP
jgi:hypothetical protein